MTQILQFVFVLTATQKLRREYCNHIAIHRAQFFNFRSDSVCYFFTVVVIAHTLKYAALNAVDIVNDALRKIFMQFDFVSCFFLTIKSRNHIITMLFMRLWRNWQTRTFEGRMSTTSGFKSR